MRPRFSLSVLLGALFLLSSGLAATALQAGDQPDLLVVHKIKREAFKRSKVMEYLFYMTDVHGPRLTNSPGYAAAARWAVEELESWGGLENVHLESWEPFGKGWSTSRFAAHLVEPQYAPLIGVPLAWTPGTDGVVSGTPELLPFELDGDEEQMQADLDEFIETHQGRLESKILLFRRPPSLEPRTEPATERYDPADLAGIAEAQDPVEPFEFDPDNLELPESREDFRRFREHVPWYFFRQLRQRRRPFYDRLNRFLVDEGVRLLIYPAGFGDGGTIFPGRRGGSHRLDAATPPPSISLTPEHYNRIARLVKKGIPTTIEVEVEARFHDASLDGQIVVAELPGGAKKDELVLIGGHYDDVVYATGATDNAAGCAVMMEALRILHALDLELDRTVRLVLWDGEEQGLLGSAAYVKKHFGDRVTMELQDDHAKVSAYYNLDNGTGKIRGIYLQENDMVRSIFSSWLAPFRDLGASTVAIRNTGGTDHLSFDQVGIPGFQFIQDPVEYDSRTHHSNMDVYDRLQASDLMQAAAIVATFVYHTANREELLPRKPLPEPVPEEYRHLVEDP